MQVTSNIVPSERGRKRLLRSQRLYIPDGNVFLQYSFDGTDPDPIGRITFNTPDGTKGVPMPNLLGYSTPDQGMGVMQNPDEIVISSTKEAEVTIIEAWKEYKPRVWTQHVQLGKERLHLTRFDVAMTTAGLYKMAVEELQQVLGDCPKLGEGYPVTFEQMVLVFLEKTSVEEERWQAVFAVDVE